MLFILNSALVVDISDTARVGGMAAGLATIAGVLNISDIIQLFDHDESSSVLQLIKGKWRISKNYLSILMD